MDRSTAKQLIARAQMKGDIQETWSAFKQAWEGGAKIPMDTSTFAKLFYEGSISKDAAKLIGRFREARSFLYEAAMQVSPEDLRDVDRQRVFLAVVEADDMVDRWRQVRNGLDPSGRRNFAGNIIEIISKQKGRERARQTLRELWNEFVLEEEKESSLKELDKAGGLTTSLIHDLGPDAIELVKGMWHRGELDRLPYNIQSAPVRLTSKPNSDPAAIDRVSCLLQPLELLSDLRDACLRPNEFSRLSLFSEVGNMEWEKYIETFARMMDRAGIAPRSFIRKELRRSGFPWMFFPGSISQTKLDKQSTLQFPLIRLLHLREILDAPELSSSRMHPERFMVPEVLLHIFDVEPVVYFPELRIGRESERRWRARWAESMGETMSTLFMEAALDIDLTLLERIPETPGEMTADFKTATKQGELIVYESKGSTDWETHRKQRRKALKQIGKSKSHTGGRTGDSDGRAFACSFYGALQGAMRSTLFHVEDPPFGFDHLFDKGWEEQARRRHYAAVLQFLDQFELAENLLKPELEPEAIHEQIPRTKPQQFRLQLGGEREEGSLYIGAYDDLGVMARRMGLRKPSAFEGWKLFRGIDERKFRDLVHGKLPSPKNSDDHEEKSPPSVPSTGVIPSEKRGRGRGVYSLLNNGAFFAIIVDKE